MSKHVEEKKEAVQFLTFGSKRFKQTIKSHKEVLNKYNAGFEEASKLAGDSKIFLDTNIILRVYKTSFKAREKLLQFFKEYQERIVIPAQVQWEYVKNRENVINTFNNEVTRTIPEDFRKLVITNIVSFKNDKKSTLIDYPLIWEKLEVLEKEANELLISIDQESGKNNSSTNDILYNDDFIDVFQNFELLEPLSDDHLKLVKGEYESFIKEINKSESEKELFKVFPGCFEKKDKEDDPFGDYIIYNEMLNYSLRNNTSIIFLTHDVTKGDWIQKNKNPHLHYVENFFLNTSQLLYILNGQRTFDDLLDINFKSLISAAVISTTSNNLTVDELRTFITDHPAFFEAPPAFRENIVEELAFNGYKTISEINETLLKGIEFLPFISNVHSNFSKLALFRACMTAGDPDYKVFSVSDQFVRMNYSKGEYIQPN